MRVPPAVTYLFYFIKILRADLYVASRPNVVFKHSQLETLAKSNRENNLFVIVQIQFISRTDLFRGICSVRFTSSLG